MAETHAAGGKSIGRLVLEVALIALGVFLGLMGEQWRIRSEHRELAEGSLRAFRTEILTNQKAVAAVSEYHAVTLKSLREYFAAEPDARKAIHVRIHGLQPVHFEGTAWQMALATQSLAYFDHDLAFSLSQVYGVQRDYEELSRGILQAMYQINIRDNFPAFAGATETYYGDITLLEPRLSEMYADLLPRINRALGE